MTHLAIINPHEMKTWALSTQSVNWIFLKTGVYSSKLRKILECALIEYLLDTYKRLLAQVKLDKHRYLYDQFHMKDRLTGIIGARGVGKTTLMLQFIKDNLANDDKTIYVSADNIYFNEYTLLSFVTQSHENDGIENFFIDEIHRYANWNQELKNIVDSFPTVKIVFSGISSIDLVKGSYDLSRRAKLFHLHGLSFREYLYFITDKKYPVVSYNKIIKHPNKIADDLSQIPKLKGHFKNYLSAGYYPFELDDMKNLYEKLQRIIDKTIHEDIANHYHLKTENLPQFKD